MVKEIHASYENAKNALKAEKGALMKANDWDKDAHDFITCHREAGITEIAITDQSTALMRLLHIDLIFMHNTVKLHLMRGINILC